MPTLDAIIDARKAQQGAQQFDTATTQMKGSAAVADASVKKTDKALAGLSAQVSRAAIGLVGLGAAYKGIRYTTTAVKDFAAFELGLANVSTMLNDQTMKYLPEYEKQISRLATQYGQATGTLNKGLYDILSASVDASEAITLLEVSSKAAIAGLTDTGIAADALTTILNSYGFAATDASRVSDILFTVVKRGKLTFGELAGSIGHVAALAASSGLSLEEVGAAIATMTRSGISADIAMTSLKAILTTFLSPTEDSIKVARELGIELNTTTLRTIGLTGVMKKLATATAEQRSAIFPNVRAITGLATVVQDVTGNLADLEAMTTSSGASLEAFGKIANTTSQQLAKNREILAAIKRDLGEGLAPQVNTWLSGFTILVDDWQAGWRSMVNSSEIAKQVIVYGFDTVGPVTRQYTKLLLDADAAITQLKDNTISLAIWQERMAKKASETLTPKTHWSVIEEQQEAASRVSKEYTEEQIKAGLAVTDYFNAIKIERESLFLSNEERDRAAALLEFEAQAKLVSVSNTEQLVKIYDEELKSLQKLQSQKAAGLKVTALFDELKAERSLIGLTNDERERAIRVMELEANAKILLGDKSGEIVEKYKEELTAMQQARIEAAEMEKYYTAVNESLEGVIKSPMTAILDDTRDIGEVLKGELINLASDILGIMYKDVITTPLMGALKESVAPAMSEIMGSIKNALVGIAGGAAKGMGSLIGGGIASLFGGAGGAVTAADGLVLNNKSVTQCAKGNILSGPTIFPMSNGGLALGGEAGKEGLFPLGRDSQGRLGVRAIDAETKAEQRPLNIINVLDSSGIQEYLGTGSGEEQIVNIMRKNSNLIV